MKYKSWTKHASNPKFWDIFAKIVLEDIKVDKTMESIKIDVPKGYEIDKEKSTFENIVFKKVDEAIVKWNNRYSGVEIKAEGEYFVINAESPSFYCTWNEAVKYYDRPYYIWKLPTVKQLQVLSKYINEVNEVIRNHEGFEIKGILWSKTDKNNVYAWNVDTYNGFTTFSSKDVDYYVRAVSNL